MVVITTDQRTGYLFNGIYLSILDLAIKLKHSVVAVAQLVRALDCGSGGRGFEPHRSPH